MRTDGKPENQHYVPKMLLRPFSIGKKRKEKLYLYDKRLGKPLTSPTNIGKVAAERGFYEFEVGADRVASAEHIMHHVETLAEKPLDKLRSCENLSEMTSEEIAAINVFVTVQYMRGTNFRYNVLEMDNKLRDFVIGDSGDESRLDLVENWRPFAGENDVKMFSILFIQKSVPEFTQIISSKHLILQKTTTHFPFWISDNPVTLYNHNDFGPRGNLGLNSRGIQIYMPISPTICLSYLCPSILEEMKEGLSTVNQLRAHKLLSRASNGFRINTPDTEELNKNHSVLTEHIRTIESAGCFNCNEQNVEFLNSLQYQSAQRFIMSRISNFRLAERIQSGLP